MALRSDQLVSRAEVRGSVLGWKQECRCPGFRARCGTGWEQGVTSEDVGVEKERPGRAGQRGGVSDARRAAKQTAGPDAQKCRSESAVAAGGRSWVGWRWALAGGRQGRRLCRAGRWKDQLLEERGGRAGWGAGILPDATRAGLGGGAAGRTVAALEKGRPQAKSRGPGVEDLEPSRAWKDQAQRIQCLKEWILRFGLWREGGAQEQELLLEGSGPARSGGRTGC